MSCCFCIGNSCFYACVNRVKQSWLSRAETGIKTESLAARLVFCFGYAEPFSYE